MGRVVVITGCALFLLLVLVPAGFRIWFQLPHPSDQQLIDNLRLNESYYRELVATESGRQGSDVEGRVLIEESEREWGEVGERTWATKGYAYSREELHPLVESLDEFRAGEEIAAYKKIEGNWYLYYHASVEKPE
jgi:hypothetical protein